MPGIGPAGTFAFGFIGNGSGSGTQVTGTYTPVSSNHVNIGSLVLSDWRYGKFGDMVIVGGKMELTPDAPQVPTSFEVTLPITDQNFDDDSQAGGMGVDNGAGGSGTIVFRVLSVGSAKRVVFSNDKINGADASVYSVYFLYAIQH